MESYSGLQTSAEGAQYPSVGAAVGVVKSNQAAAPTLVRAISSIDELNKRLHVLSGQAYEIAQAVGGPYPVGGVKGADDPKPQHAMARLNDSITSAHSTLTDIEHALGAIRRSLGA